MGPLALDCWFERAANRLPKAQTPAGKSSPLGHALLFQFPAPFLFSVGSPGCWLLVLRPPWLLLLALLIAATADEEALPQPRRLLCCAKLHPPLAHPPPPPPPPSIRSKTETMRCPPPLPTLLDSSPPWTLPSSPWGMHGTSILRGKVCFFDLQYHNLHHTIHRRRVFRLHDPLSPPFPHPGAQINLPPSPDWDRPTSPWIQSSTLLRWCCALRSARGGCCIDSSIHPATEHWNFTKRQSLLAKCCVLAVRHQAKSLLCQAPFSPFKNPPVMPAGRLVNLSCPSSPSVNGELLTDLGQSTHRMHGDCRDEDREFIPATPTPPLPPPTPAASAVSAATHHRTHANPAILLPPPLPPPTHRPSTTASSGGCGRLRRAGHHPRPLRATPNPNPAAAEREMESDLPGVHVACWLRRRAAKRGVSGVACGKQHNWRLHAAERRGIGVADRRRSRRAARGSSPEMVVVVVAVEPEKEEEDGKGKRKEEDWRRGLTGARRCDAWRREQGLAVGKGCGARRMRRRRGRKKVAGERSGAHVSPDSAQHFRRSTELPALLPASFQKVKAAQRCRHADPACLPPQRAPLSCPWPRCSDDDQRKRALLVVSVVEAIPFAAEVPIPAAFLYRLLHAAFRVAAILYYVTAGHLLGRVRNTDTVRRVVTAFVERQQAASSSSEKGRRASLCGGGSAADELDAAGATMEKVARTVDEARASHDCLYMYRAVYIYLKVHLALDKIECDKVCSALVKQAVLTALYYDQLKLRSATSQDDKDGEGPGSSEGGHVAGEGERGTTTNTKTNTKSANTTAASGTATPAPSTACLIANDVDHCQEVSRQHATSSLAARMEDYGLTVNDSKSLRT
ncbi:hypothetical protein HU200_018547 [Digitaria exilis]|uniref:Uncharacterized protein n=1 Tax=Digitaria exilis TaxID=1010633 RepID=A0A835F494_9POAL|nr:hypothetical protein HU200_018547 [Digitaria exilis]